MASIEFNDEPQSVQTVSRGSSLTNLIISFGLAKDQKGAQGVMIAIVVIALGLTGWLLFSLKGPEPKDPGFKEGQNVLVQPQ